MRRQIHPLQDLLFAVLQDPGGSFHVRSWDPLEYCLPFELEPVESIGSLTLLTLSHFFSAEEALFLYAVCLFFRDP